MKSHFNFLFFVYFREGSCMLSDSKIKYGAITRFFHWLMAAGFLWMLFTAIVHFIDRDSALNKAIWPYHPLVGFSIFMLAILRIVWSLIQAQQRPDNNLPARLRHLALYVFMLVAPIIALLRQYGSGRVFNYFNWQVMQASDHKIQALVDFGNQWHSICGWFLFLLIIGHTIMAFYHRGKGPQFNVFPRIIGSTKN